MRPQIYGSAAAINNRAVLIIGTSASGKSSLLLSLMARGFTLIGDDQLLLTTKKSKVWVRPHENAKRRVEVRNVDLVRAQSETEAPLELVVNLNKAPRERIPKREYYRIGEQEIRKIDGKGVPQLTDYIYLLLSNYIKPLNIE